MLLNRLSVIACSCLILLLCLPPNLLASGCKSLSATGNSEYPPYLWRESQTSQTLSGAIALIINELGRRLEIDISLQHVGSWSRAQEEVKAGRIDLIAGAFYTVARNQWMDYVYPAFLNTTSVVWKNAASNFSYLDKTNLLDKVGVTVINNSFGQEFDEFAKTNLKIEQVASLWQAFKMLQLNRVEYALYEKNPGLAFAAQMGISKEIVALDPPISQEGLYLTISHNSKCNTGSLRGKLAKHMREMLADGYNQKALTESLTKWEKVNP